MANNFKEYSDMDISALVEGMNAGILDYTFEDLKEVQTELVNRRMSSRYMGIISGLMREKIEKGEVEENADGTTTDNKPEEIVATQLEETIIVTPKPLIPIQKVTPKPIVAAPPIAPAIEAPAIEAPAIAPAIRKIAPPLPTEFPKAPSTNKPESKTKKENDTYENEYPTFAFLAAFFKVWAWICVGATLIVYGVVSYCWLSNSIPSIICAGIIALFVACISLIVCYCISENFRWKIDIAKKLSK